MGSENLDLRAATCTEEESLMSFIEIPLERLLFGNEHWRSYSAIDEIEIYCDLLDNLQDRVDSLETRGKDEEVAVHNVQAVVSSYTFEIAMKSLWALDNSDKPVRHKHDLLSLFDALREDTVESLKQLHLTREVLERCPKPFYSNRYSMEPGCRNITVYPSRLLRPLLQLLREKLEESKEALVKPLKPR